jgi:hypothetical protein
MNSREQLLTSLDANRIIEAIHWLFEDKQRLELKISELVYPLAVIFQV